MDLSKENTSNVATNWGEQGSDKGWGDWCQEEKDYGECLRNGNCISSISTSTTSGTTATG